MTHRRQLTAALKAQVVLELLSGAKRRAELCREDQMTASVLAGWKTLFLRHAPAAFDSPEPRNGQEATQVAELERLVGRLTLEPDIFKKATSIVPQWSRPSGRSSSCSATSILYARSVGCWEPRAAATTQRVPSAATLSTHTLHALGVQIRMATVGEATDNGDAERLMRTITAEEVRLHDYADFRAAYQPMGRCLDDVYQHKRLHLA